MIEGNAVLDHGRKLDGLQAGRGLAAVTVVIAHGIGHPYVHAPGLLGMLGQYGVVLFFVISGFIMVRTTGPGKFDPRVFVERRIRRIVPLYYIACMVLALLALMSPGSFKTTTLYLPHIIRSLLFIPSYAPRDPTAIFPFFKLGWTLNFEMFFYAVFALLFFLRARPRAISMTVLFAALVVIGQLVRFEAAPLAFYTRANLIGFVVGMWIAVGGVDARPTLRRGSVAVLLVASLILLAVCAWFYQSIQFSPLLQIGLSAVVMLHVIVLLRFADRDHRRVPAWAIAAGDASYSMYLFHMFAVGPIHAALRPLGPNFLWLAMLLAALGGITVGFIVYRFVERPLTRLLRPRLGRSGITTDRDNAAPATPLGVSS